MDMGYCASCEKRKANHKHHIVPLSRGGGDNKGNLTFLCHECHGLAHDVSFSGDDGLISNSMFNKKEELKRTVNLLCDDDINTALNSLSSDDYELIILLLLHGKINTIHLCDLIKTGSTKVKFVKTFFTI